MIEEITRYSHKIKIHQASVECYYIERKNFGKEHSETPETFKSLIENYNATILLDKRYNEIIGCMVYFRLDDVLKDLDYKEKIPGSILSKRISSGTYNIFCNQNKTFINTLLIKRNHISTSLIREYNKIKNALGLVDKKNKQSIEFYKAFGAKIVGETEPITENGSFSEGLHIMSKD